MRKFKLKDNKMRNLSVGLFSFVLIFLFFGSGTTRGANHIGVNNRDVDHTTDKGYVSVRPLLNVKPDKVPVCYVMAAFTKHGGTEMWVKSVTLMIEESLYFTNFGIYSWDLVSDDYLKLLINKKMNDLRTLNEVKLYCSIILSTAHVPLMDDTIFKILVIHGGATSEWTKKYSKFHKNYDHIIGVSADSLELSLGSAGDYIPSIVRMEEHICEQITECSSPFFLFVGRMSPEKRPEKICELLSQLPSYCSIMIGPFYFNNNFFSCASKNVHYIGPQENITCYMDKAIALLVPSSEEGGPIVAIEAWSRGLPVVMGNVGLSRTCPGCFLNYDWDRLNAEEFMALIDGRSKSDVIIKAKSVYEDEFSEKTLKSKWSKVLTKALVALESVTLPSNSIKFEDSDGFFVRKIGKVIRLNCFNDLCTIKMLSSKPISSVVNGEATNLVVNEVKVFGNSRINLGTRAVIKCGMSDFVLSDIRLI